MADVPSSFEPVQQPALQYNNPVSEASLAALAGPINGLLSVALPVGSTVNTLLTEIQFQAQIGNPTPSTWVLADGRDVTGSSYASITGHTTIPDLRGIMQRAKNNGRSDGNENPDGELALGALTTSRNISHNHTVLDPAHSHQRAQGGSGSDNSTTNPAYGSNGSGSFGTPSTTSNVTGITLVASGGGDAAPTNVTVNTMIRIN